MDGDVKNMEMRLTSTASTGAVFWDAALSYSALTDNGAVDVVVGVVTDVARAAAASGVDWVRHGVCSGCKRRR